MTDFTTDESLRAQLDELTARLDRIEWLRGISDTNTAENEVN